MAPLPFNNTSVLFVDYATQGFPHQVQCRFDSPSTVDDAMASVDEWFAAIANAIGETTITSARWLENGGSVTTDVVWIGSPAYGDGTGDPFESAQYYDWIGRSPGGRRVRVAVFGAQNLQNGGDYRSQLGEDVALDAGLAVLQAAEGTFLAIDGTQPIWKNYTNMGVNAYWRNKIR